MSRADLAQLDAEALILLANRGLVKRATRMIERGKGPVLEEADGVVTGTFPDKVQTTWPPDTALADVQCTCGALTICRHAIAVALAYEGETTAPSGPWDPGEAFDDAQLLATYGKRAVAAAERDRTRGMEVRLVRGQRPVAHLPTGTVRFPVEGALDLAYSDVVDDHKPRMVILAVWAFRGAEKGDEVVVRLGPPEEALDLAPVTDVRRVLDAVLTHGLANLPGTVAADLTRAVERSTAARWTWMTGALEDLAAQHQAWTERSLVHSVERSARVVGEIVGRARAAQADAPPSAAWFLGVGIASKSELEHLTLTGLGARARGVGDRVELEVYLYDLNARALLVIQKEVEAGGSLRRHKMGGLQLAGLARGSLTTRGATRRANRGLHLKSKRGGIRVHDLREQAGSWSTLPETMCVESLEQLRETILHRPPRHLRPRVLAEDLRVLEVAAVQELHWDPGEQRLMAIVSNRAGETYSVEADHDPVAPGAAAAVGTHLPSATHVAGHVRLRGGGLVLEPTAIATPTRVVVPVMEASGTVTAAVGSPAASDDPLVSLLERLHDRLAEIAHLGLVRGGRRVETFLPELRNLGLDTLANRVARLAESATVEAWSDAWLTTVVCMERVDG